MLRLKSWRGAIVAAAIIVLGLLPSTASAEVRWLRREFDPRDLPSCGPDCLPVPGWDVRSVTLRIRLADNGRRYLTITLRSYDPQGGFASGIALDTKGGPRADFRAYLDQARTADELPAGPGRARCGVRPARPESDIRRGAFRHFNDGSVATCRLPLRWVEPTRSIRWHVWTRDLFPQPWPTLDRAPDRGWSG